MAPGASKVAGKQSKALMAAGADAARSTVSSLKQYRNGSKALRLLRLTPTPAGTHHARALEVEVLELHEVADVDAAGEGLGRAHVAARVARRGRRREESRLEAGEWAGGWQEQGGRREEGGGGRVDVGVARMRYCRFCCGSH